MQIIGAVGSILAAKRFLNGSKVRIAPSKDFAAKVRSEPNLLVRQGAANNGLTGLSISTIYGLLQAKEFKEKIE